MSRLDRTSKTSFSSEFASSRQFLSLEIEITVYFATKSIDEFLTLQQTANIEIIKAIKESGADLALPMTVVSVSEDEILASLLKSGLVRQSSKPSSEPSESALQPPDKRGELKKYFTDESIQRYGEDQEYPNRTVLPGDSGGFVNFYNDFATGSSTNEIFQP